MPSTTQKRKSIPPATLKEAVQGKNEQDNFPSTVLGIDLENFQHTIDVFKYSLDYAEAIVNTVREPLIVLNKDLQVMTANRAFYEKFQLLPENLENRPFYEMGTGELNIPKFKKLLKDILAKGKKFDDFEVKYDIPKNGTRTLIINARRFYRQINATQTILLAIEDVTELREFEKKKDEFAAIIIHELKGPVSTINGYLQLFQAHLTKQLAQDNTASKEKLLTYAENMKTQVRRLTSLINGLLNSSKIRATGFDYQKSTFEINDIIVQTINEVQQTSSTHKIINEGNITVSVDGDRERISQVLVNLVTNAIKYSPNAAKVVVSSTTKDGNVIISVKDFGIGISKINQKKIFQRFFRVNGIHKEPFYAIGLGLDISSQIIHHHNGRMWVDSTEGQGSSFNFSLPIRPIATLSN